MIFSEVIVEHWKNLLFNLTNGKSKIDRLAGDFCVWIIRGIAHRNALLPTHLQSNNSFFELRQSMTGAHFEHVILAFPTREGFAAKSSFEINCDKVTLLNNFTALH